MFSDWYRGEAVVDFGKVDVYVHQLKGSSSRLVLDSPIFCSFPFHFVLTICVNCFQPCVTFFLFCDRCVNLVETMR